MKKSWAIGIPTLLSHLVNLLRCQRGSLDGVVAQHARLVIRETWVRVPLRAKTNFSDAGVLRGKNAR